MQIRCPHCHDPIEVVQDVVSFDCPSCGKRVQLADAQTIVQPVESAPTSDTATLALDGGISPPVVGETGAERIHYFGDYELLEEIARGGMGVVYKARQVSLNRTVAVKMILAGQLAGEEDVRRFLTEAEAAANLQHPHIVAIHEVGEHKGQHFFSMDYVEGTDLSALISDNPLPAREAADYVQCIASAIQYAHEQGTLHRDLKPSNILIDGNGEPHITDFGIAKRIAPDADDTEMSPGEEGSETVGQQQEVAQLTATGAVLGTPSYMPPEQAGAKQSDIGPHSDVYSLGAILYCLLTGRPPFQAENPLSTMLQVLQQEPVPLRLLNPSLSRDLETICLKCLEKDPGRRYQAAGELADELDCYLSGKPITARPVGRLERGWRWCRRNPAVAGLSTAVIGVTIIATLVIMFGIIQFNLVLQEELRRKENANIYRGRSPAMIIDEDLYHLPDSRRLFPTGVIFSPTGKQIVIQHADNTVRVLDIQEQSSGNDHSEVVWDQFDHSRELSTDGHVGHHVWLTLPHDKDDFAGLWLPLQYTSDGQQLRAMFQSSRHTWKIHTYDVAGLTHKTRTLSSDKISPTVFEKPDVGSRTSHTSTRLSSNWRYLAFAWRNTVDVCDVETGDLVQTFQTTTSPSFGRIEHWTISPGGQLIAIRVSDKRLEVWGSVTGKLVSSFDPPRDGRMSGTMAINHDNSLVAVGYRVNSSELHQGHVYEKEPSGVVLLDARTGKIVHNLFGLRSTPERIAFSPDGFQIAASKSMLTFDLGEIVIWSTETGHELGRYYSHFGVINHLSYSPDGRWLISGDNSGHYNIWYAAKKHWGVPFRSLSERKRLTNKERERRDLLNKE